MKGTDEFEFWGFIGKNDLGMKSTKTKFQPQINWRTGHCWIVRSYLILTQVNLPKFKFCGVYGPADGSTTAAHVVEEDHNLV